MKKTSLTLFSLLFLGGVCHAQWTQSLGTESLNMQSLITVGSNDFAGGQTGAYISSDEAGTYALSNSGNDAVGPTRGFAYDGTYIYTCTSQGVFRSADNGANWISKSAGITNLLTSGIIYSAPYLIVVGPDGVFKSNDDGDSWTSAGLSGTDVRCVTAINDTLFVGTNGSGIYTTIDWGANWTAVNNGLGGSTNFRAIEAKGSSLFAGGQIGTGVFRSTDHGLNWTLLGGGLPSGSYRGFASNSNLIVAGSFGAGVFYSTDNGDSWIEINSGLLDLTIFDLELNNNYIIAATDSEGVFRFSLTNILSTSELELDDNLVCYPNPTKSNIWISSETGLNAVQYAIIDSKGSTLHAGTLDGFQSEINLQNLPSGIYFLNLDGSNHQPFKIIKE